ncbi:MAG: phenylalanine--tRNA ligase subunit alpha [Euryarchaeota archaeon]|nr:phenylalanine--tRNA ligase subunit alpha [Euryarchaeota archaeon]
MTEIPSVSPKELDVLRALERLEKCIIDEIVKDVRLKDKSEAAAIIAKLETKGLVKVKKLEEKYVILDEEGVKYCQEGLPERKILKVLYERKEIPIKDLKGLVDMDNKILSPAIGWVLRKGWAKMEKKGEDKVLIITELGEKAINSLGKDEKLLLKIKERGSIPIESIDKKLLKDLSSRKNVIKIVSKPKIIVEITELGKDVLKSSEIEVGALTPEMLRTGSWRSVKFRRYGLEGYVGMVYAGRIHPMTYIIRKIRRIFLEMGFKEIRGDFVTSAFWNMDVLFVPQDHPARDLQDTYYLKEPFTLEIDSELASIIKEVHENGGKTGSIGWKYLWDPKVAEKALLRSHTTAVTIKYLAEHPDEVPLRAFIIGRVFRREAVDATHLSEFTQVDGIIVEEKANLRMLIGVLKEFYRRLGFKDVRVRPSYFPYTEPSLEIFVKFKGRWLELGGAGIFRPEVTEPLGIKGRVLAWGLGLERLVALILGLDDIRKIYVPEISWLRMSPIRPLSYASYASEDNW